MTIIEDRQQVLFNRDEYTGGVEDEWGWSDCGGQFKNSFPLVGGNCRGQPDPEPVKLPPTDQNCRGQQLPPTLSLFDKNEGDPGTWVERKHRDGNIYLYLRWRELSGKKKSKYLRKL